MTDLPPTGNLEQCLGDHRQGRVLVSGTPDMLTIESTAICNLRCVMCPQSIGAVERPKHMSWSLGEKLEPFLARAGKIQLHGIGEPMTSSAFWRLVQILPGGAFGEVNSNFTVLDREKIENLVASRLALINVSLDAARPETYRKIRNFDFETVLRNVRTFIERRNVLGKSAPMLRINMTLMRENIAEVVEFVELARRLGVDGVEMWQLNVLDDEEMKRYHHQRGGWEFKYADQVLSRHAQLSNHWITKAAERAAQLGVQLTFPSRDRAIIFRTWIASLRAAVTGAGRRRVTTRDCQNPWRWLMVTSNGGVRPCCYATSDVANLEQESLQEVWNGARMQQVRRELLGNRVPSICQGAACEYVKNARATLASRANSSYGRSVNFLQRAWRGVQRRLRALGAAGT